VVNGNPSAAAGVPVVSDEGETVRRLVLILLATAAWIAVAVSPALAKEVGANLSVPPPGLNAGEPWTTGLFIVSESHGLQTGTKPPTLTIERSTGGETADFVATPGGEDGVYRVRVVFPEAGHWRYWVTDPVTGRRYPFPPVTIGEPVATAAPTPPAAEREPAPAAGERESFPWWPIAAGAGALLLVAMVLGYRRGPRRAARAAQ
jgi:hypothetical protein